MKKITSVFLSILFILSLFVPASAQSITYNQIVNASCAIIVRNEGDYSSVVKDDCGAVSLGILGWHATRALVLLKEIISKNPAEAKNILGTSFYNEITSKSNWDTRIFSSAEASSASILLATSYAKDVQNETAFNDIGEYVTHGKRLGITDAKALVFFADIENQNGYTGAANFYSHTVYETGNSHPTLANLYTSSSRDSRRTRTYEFCLGINWADYVNGFSKPKDTVAPRVTDATLVGSVTSVGYTLSFKTSDNVKVTSVYTATFLTSDGSDKAVWKQYAPAASMQVDIRLTELGGRYGKYTTIIYAVDDAGNYGYSIIGPIEVADPSLSNKIKAATATDKTLIRPGETFTCMAMGFDGSGEYSYKFELYRGDERIDMRDWSTYRLYEVNPELYETVTGVYRVKATVRDNKYGTTAAAETDDVKVLRKINITSLTVDKEEIHTGESVRYTLSASGGEGKLQYKFTVYRDNIAVKESSFSSSKTFTYKATAGGNYRCVCTVKDSYSQKENKTSKSTRVIAPIKLSKAQKSRSYAVSGMLVKFWADTTGGAGDNLYTYSIYVDNKKIDEIVSRNNFLNLTVQTPGAYKVVMNVRDMENTSSTITISGLTVERKPKKGDADLSGKVDAKDARFILRCSAGLQEPTENFEYLCDVDSNGEIRAKDARYVLRYSARLAKLP